MLTPLSWVGPDRPGLALDVDHTLPPQTDLGGDPRRLAEAVVTEVVDREPFSWPTLAPSVSTRMMPSAIQSWVRSSVSPWRRS